MDGGGVLNFLISPLFSYQSLPELCFLTMVPTYLADLSCKNADILVWVTFSSSTTTAVSLHITAVCPRCCITVMFSPRSLEVHHYGLLPGFKADYSNVSVCYSATIERCR